MKKNDFRIFLAAAIVCVFALGVLTIIRFAQRNIGESILVLQQETVIINNSKLALEIAATPEEQVRGLGGRDSLLPDSGMIFPFVHPGKPGFWMKDMRFALDFIYVRGNKIVEFKEAVKPALVPTLFFPAEDVDAVIEVNAGWVAAHGIRVGDIFHTD